MNTYIYNKVKGLVKIVLPFYLFTLLPLATACTPTPHDVEQSTQEAEIYPDYKDVTIPVNIAPMNFVVRGA